MEDARDLVTDDREYLRDPPGDREPGPFRLLSMSSVVARLAIVETAIFFLVVIVVHVILGRVYGIADAERRVLEWVGLVPARALGEGYLWQLFTYMFVHGPGYPGVWHFLFAVATLLWAGSELEAVYGRAKLLFLFVGAGVAAGLAHGFWWRQALPVAGATGCVYGLLVAFAFLFPRRQVLFLFLIPIEVRFLVPLVLGFDVAMFLAAKRYDGLAHLGGALFGLLFFRYEDRLSRFLDRVEERAARRETEAVEDLETELDSVLDKISRTGMGSLSRKEREFLKRASRHYQRNR